MGNPQRHRAQTYADILDSLLATSEGKYALISGEKIVGIYDSALEATSAGYRELADTPFLVRQIESAGHDRVILPDPKPPRPSANAGSIAKTQWRCAGGAGALISCVVLTLLMLRLEYQQNIVYYIVANTILFSTLALAAVLLHSIDQRISRRHSRISARMLTCLAGLPLGLLLTVALTLSVPLVSALVSLGDILHTGIEISMFTFQAALIGFGVLLGIAGLTVIVPWCLAAARRRGTRAR